MVISKKHGLNPSMDICFFCGETKGIALFGKMKGDAEAPRQVLLNYEPCDKCKEAMDKGTTIVEVVTEDNGNRQIVDGAYPTSRWCVMRSEAAKEIFETDNKMILLEKKAYSVLTRSNGDGETKGK